MKELVCEMFNRKPVCIGLLRTVRAERSLKGIFAILTGNHN